MPTRRFRSLATFSRAATGERLTAATFGQYRETHTLSLMEALTKMTLMPAQPRAPGVGDASQGTRAGRRGRGSGAVRSRARQRSLDVRRAGAILGRFRVRARG